MMLANMGSVKTYESIKDRPEAHLSFGLINADQNFSLSLMSRTPGQDDGRFRPSEVTTKEISVQRIEGGYGRESTSYRLGVDGIVRRWDGGDVTEKMRKKKELGIADRGFMERGASPDEMVKITSAKIQDMLENQIPNARLEQDMGYNNQPVPVEEINGLREFIAQSTLTVK